jgi:uncharacterized protein DUF4365
MGLGEDNLFRGDYGEAWLRAVAAGSGLLHGRPTSLDLEKADVELVRRGFCSGVWNPTVKVQVKTTVDLREENGDFIYDLDVATCDVLRRDNETVRRILAVFLLPKSGDKIRLLKRGTLLAGYGAWASLEGCPPTTNKTSQAVRLPVANTIDRSGLERMLEKYGGRSSTPTREIDAWGKS